MNAVTQTETRAIETAAPLEVADPTKNLILVPLAVAAASLQAQRTQDPAPVHSRNWPRASPASACCKTLSSSCPPMASNTKWWRATAD